MQIVLHLGVHKTASTYLQAVLEASRDGLRAEGIGYVTLKEMRSGITARVRRPGLLGMRLAMTARRLLEGHKDCRRLILSDENISGGSRELIDGLFYSAAGKRAESLAKALGSDDVRIMVATRSYDSFVASCYCEHLQHFPFLTPSEYLAAFDIACLDWSILIADLCRRFGQEHVTVWRFEDFNDVEDEVLSAMAGDVAIDWVKPSRPLRQSLPQKAVDALIALVPLLNRKEISRVLEPVSKALGEHGTPFRTYDDETARALRARYDRNIETLAHSFPRMRMIRRTSRAVEGVSDRRQRAGS